MSGVINLISWSIHDACKGKENFNFLYSRFYPYLSFSDLKSVHKAFAMSFYSLLRLSSSCLPLGRNSARADLFTRQGQLRYPDFHHLLSNQTKQRILSYQFGSRMWIYFTIPVNFATLWKRERERRRQWKIETSWVSNLTQRQSRKYRRPCQMHFTSGVQ
jgi:hypothetical protein